MNPIKTQGMEAKSTTWSTLAFLVSRYRAHVWTKRIGISTALTAFFACYFAILRHPIFAVTTMPLTDIDLWIPFQPSALYLYASLWVYVPLLPILMVESKDLKRYAMGAIALSVIGFTLFILVPTITPGFDAYLTQDRSMVILKSLDASGNACPSLHVAFAVFNAIGFYQMLRDLNVRFAVQVANILWCAGIVYSTMATKQHVALDVLAGGLLGAVMAWVTFYSGLCRESKG